MRGSTENNKGFTIVELLIVIVVIGILAAITIVTYTSAQGRAKDARIVATITQYTDILNIYRVNKGTYPVIDTGSDYKACLGDQYPAETNYPANACAISGSIATTVNTTINNDLRTIAGQLPATKDFANQTFFGMYIRGLVYEYRNADEAGIIYYYKGNRTTCPVGDVYQSYNGTLMCTLTVRKQ